MKFDVIVGNPPYQGQKKKAAKLWPKFFGKSIELLTDGGYLTYVSPSTWLNRAPRGSWKYLKDWDVTSVITNVKEWFPEVGSSFAVTSLIKRAYGGRTSVNNSFELNLHKDFFPADGTQLTEENVEFLRKMNANKLKLDYISGSQIPIDDPRLSIDKTDKHIYETFYTSAKKRRSIWCSEKHGDHGKLKLIVGLYGGARGAEITTKAAGAKSRYILGEREELEKILRIISHPDNVRWTELMMTDAFSGPFTFVANTEINYGEKPL